MTTRIWRRHSWRRKILTSHDHEYLSPFDLHLAGYSNFCIRQESLCFNIEAQMRVSNSNFIPIVLILAATVQCAFESSDSPFLLDDGTTSDLLGTTSDLLFDDTLEDFTTTTSAGEDDVHFLNDDSYNGIPLDFESSPISPDDEIAYEDELASACTQPLRKRDLSDDDLILGGYQTSFSSR